MPSGVSRRTLFRVPGLSFDKGGKMRYSKEVVEEIREKNDIVDIVSSYVDLKRKGNSYFGLCPFHNEKTGSFSVSPSKQIYYCFGCGAGGDVIKFVMEYESMTFQEVVRFLANRCGMILPEGDFGPEEKKAYSLKEKLLEIHKLAAVHYYRLLQTEEGKRAYRYLKGRELKDETIRRFGLGYASKKPGELYHFLKSKGYRDELLKESGLVTIEERGARDKFWNRAIFPILDISNRVIGFGGRVLGEGEPKYLNSPETKLFDKSKNLYGLNYARSSREDFLLLCEGYMDVIALHQAGFTNAVASLGTALTPMHCALMKRFVKKVVITYDSDRAGVNAVKRAIPLLKEAGIQVKVLSMRPYKDPDEFIKALGREEYRERIEHAKNSFLWEIDQLSMEHKGDDPAERTSFFRETARRLTEFVEPLERNNYIQAVAREHLIPEAQLKALVDSIGAHAVPMRENVPERTDKTTKGGKTGRRREKESPALFSQRLFLTLLAEDASLLEKTEQWIRPEDFTDPLYREVAEKLFLCIRSGNGNAGSVLNDYIEDDSCLRKVSEIFNENFGMSISGEERNKALSDCIRNIRMEQLNQASRSALDLKSLQSILKQKAELKEQKFEIKG